MGQLMVRHVSSRSMLRPWVLAALACSGDAPVASPVPPAPEVRYVVTLTPSTDTLPIGFTHALEALVSDQNGAAHSVDVTWTSLRPDVATVARGVVTGVAAGTAGVEARYGQAADTTLVVVPSDRVELQILPSAVNGSLGDTVAFRARLVTDTGVAQDARSVEWSATESDAVALMEDGEVELRGVGEADVIATVGAMSARASVNVFAAAVGSIAIDPPNTTLRTGSSLRLAARVRDETGRPMAAAAVRWGSSDDAVATAADDGSVRGIASGVAVISASSGLKRATAAIRVTSRAASGLTVSLPRDTIVPGYRQRAIAIPTDDNGRPIAGAAVEFRSSDPAVAVVTPAGVVTGVAPGTAAITASCDGQVAVVRLAVEPPRVASLDVLPAGAFVPIGAGGRLRAEVKDQVGQPMAGVPVSWASLSPSLLAVTPAGDATGIALGMAGVVVSSGDRTRQAGVMVTPYSVASVRLSPAATTVAAGAGVGLTATGYHPSGSVVQGAIFDWSVADSSIASVSPLGIVTGRATGATTVTVTSAGHRASATVTVSDPPPVLAVTSALMVNAPILDAGQTTQAVVTLFDADGNPLAGRPVAWESGQPDVATVSPDGVIAAVAPGSATISATADGAVSLVTVTVNAPPRAPVAEVTVTAPALVLYEGHHTQLTTLLADAEGRRLTGRSVAFASSSPSTVAVSASGLVHGITPGAATVTVTSEGVAGVVSLTVQAGPPPAPVIHAIAVTMNAGALQVGQSTRGTAVATDSSGGLIPGVAVTWASSNESVASVSSDGLVTALSPGTVTIYASAGGKSGSADLVITAEPPVVASVSVTVGSPTLVVGDRVQAVATAMDAFGNAIAGVAFTWSVSSTSVLAISADGQVTALAVGSADAEATASGVTGRVKVTVGEKPPDDGPNGLTAPPALPQVYLDFPFRPPTGRTVTVPAGANLQDILNTARRGDEIVLTAGATFTGNFVLPARPGTVADGWITIRTDKLAQLPAEGTRVTPALASLMPKLVTPNSRPALGTQLGASGYRIVGVELTVAPSYNGPQYGIVWLGDGSSAQSQVSQVASDLVLDRVYVHGQTTTDTRRCVSLNSARTQISDSYLTECHSKGTDSQAIQGHNGPGPYKIVNNTLIAATENIVFGGGDPWITGMIPSDIEIRGNYLYTPPAWKGVWLKKNLFELKAGRRILVEGNVLDGSWEDGQTGWAFMLKTENQSGACTWCATSDITIRYNYIRNAGAGIAISGREGSSPHPVGALSSRFSVVHNVIDNINVGIYKGDQRFFQVVGNAQDIEIANNTATSTGYMSNFLVMDIYPSATRLAFNRNAVSVTAYGMIANSRGEGTSALGAVAGGWQFNGNALIGAPRPAYPPTTTFVGSAAAVPRGIGADRILVNARTAGVVVP